MVVLVEDSQAATLRRDGRASESVASSDLLLNGQELVALGAQALADGDRLNGYLAVVGISQILEDFLDGHGTPLRQAAGFLSGGPRSAMFVPSVAVSLFDRALTRARRSASLLALRDDAWALAQALAGDDADRRGEHDRLVNIGQRLAKQPKAVRASLARSPSCFRSFDQHPEDMTRFVDKFVALRGEIRCPILVVGLRTSGSYLAPMCANSFRQAGYVDVHSVSVRPGSRADHGFRRTLAQAAAQNATVVLVDDPPTTGGALRSAAEWLTKAGVRPSHLTLFVPLMGAETVPSSLKPFDVVTLSLAEWSINDRLSPSSVGAAYAQVHPDASIESVEVTSLPQPLGRGHVQGRFRVAGVDTATSTRIDADVIARGVGLGYFGQFDQKVKEALPSWAPTLFGVADGVALWEAGEPITPSPHDLVRYVAERSEALGAPMDRSADLRGRQPVWEVATNEFSKVFGRLWPVARITVVEPLVRRALTPTRDSIIDGGVRSAKWMSGPDNTVVKLDNATRTFSNRDLACYDAAFDLVGASLHTGAASYDGVARRDFETLTAESISPEKWLAYQLVHLWDMRRADHNDRHEIRRQRATAVRSYLAGSLLHDVTCPSTGPLCALDIDGVVESDAMGFPAPTVQSMLSLRALCRHGFRPVLVTGRSYADVDRRRTEYPVAGIVAEYGGVISTPTGSENLLTVDELADLHTLRDGFLADSRVQLDDDRLASLRCVARHGSADYQYARSVIEQALAGVKTNFRVIEGDAQLDLVPRRITKAVGLSRLQDDLGKPEIRFAVGDTNADVVMLQLATAGAVPGHAEATAKAAAHHVSKHPFQRGLAEAIGSLIGHAPGSCASCAALPVSRQTQLMREVLSAAESSRSDLLWSLVRLSVTSRLGGRRR